MKKTYIAIDGGYLRAVFRRSGYSFGADGIDKFARHCLDKGEELLKVLFYDCLPYQTPEGGKEILHPVTKVPLTQKSKKVFWDLEQKDLFALRLGTLVFRGWHLRPGTDGKKEKDYKATFQQKGVDMRIGLDMASLAELRLADRIILLSADTDLIPAMKLCRKRGIQVVAIQLPSTPLPPKLIAHTDILRRKEWCKGLTRERK
ncbi:MAG: NYN domain-containing protein [Gammaproteobacteria bacterium]